MARRTTVLDLPGTDAWEELTDEQRARATELGENIARQVEKDTIRVRSIQDPLKRAEASDAIIQTSVVLIRHMTEVRDSAIAEGAAELPRAERAEFNKRAASLMMLSESRIRQLRVKDRIGMQDPDERGRLSRVLTRQFLKDEHFVNEKSLETLAMELGCSAQTVGAYKRRFFEEDVANGVPADESPFRQGRPSKLKRD